MLLPQGIAEMAGREEKSRYELLEISDPSTLLVRGRVMALKDSPGKSWPFSETQSVIQLSRGFTKGCWVGHWTK